MELADGADTSWFEVVDPIIDQLYLLSDLTLKRLLTVASLIVAVHFAHHHPVLAQFIGRLAHRMFRAAFSVDLGAATTRVEELRNHVLH